MLQAASTILALDDGLDILRIVHLILYISSTSFQVCLIIICCATRECCSSNRSATIIDLHSIPSAIGLSFCIVLHLARIVNLVVEGLDDTTILTREGTIALSISTLLRNQHRILTVAEVVSLNKRGAASGHTYAIL